MEWKVLRNGKLWSDRFDSEDLANEHVVDCVGDGQGEISDYEVLPMTQEEIDSY